MGEGQRGGVHDRRVVHPVPGSPVAASEHDSVLEARLAVALRIDAVDPEAERRAVAAFRAAREEGARRTAARTTGRTAWTSRTFRAAAGIRRRDDWRPRERRLRSSVRAVVVFLLAGLTLSGVAVAGVGSFRSSGTPHVPVRPSTAPSGTGEPGGPAADRAWPSPSGTTGKGDNTGRGVGKKSVKNKPEHGKATSGPAKKSGDADKSGNTGKAGKKATQTGNGPVQPGEQATQAPKCSARPEKAEAKGH